MEALYDATILLSVGLTAVLGAIFAIATTFLGRSLQQARERKEEQEREAEQLAKASIEKINAQIQQALKNGTALDAIASLRKQLKDAEKADKKLRRSSIFLPTKPNPKLLGVLGSVIIPGFSFIVAVALSSIAKANIDDPDGKDFVLWFFSLMFLVYGMWFLLLTLKEVERVSSTSEDENFKRQVLAFKQALAEREEETRPVCEVTCEGGTPIRMRPGEKQTIKLFVSLVQGYTMHRIELSIFVPEGLTIIEPDSELVPNVGGAYYQGWTRAILINDIALGRRYFHSSSVTIEVPQVEGSYKIGYAITSEEYEFNTVDNPDAEFTLEVTSE